MTAIALDAIGTQPVRIPPVAEEWQAEILRYAATLLALQPSPPMNKAETRYMLPDPITGEPVPRGYGRVSNLASSLDDPYGIHQWEQGLLIEGMLEDPELPAAYRRLADAITPDDQAAALAAHRITANCATPRQGLAALRAHAMWVAGRDLKADLGTAFHTIAEHSDANQPITSAPLQALEALHAYDQALIAHGIEIIPEWIEACVVNPAVGVAGRADRFVRVPGVEHPVVADLKTGKTEGREIQHAIQLACYAHATHIWTPDGYKPMPEVDHDLGLVIAVDLEAGTCEIVPLNIAEGWRRAQIAAEARKANTEPKAVRATMPERPSSAPEAPNSGGVGEGGAGSSPPSPQIAHLAERIRTIDADERLQPLLYAAWHRAGDPPGPSQAHLWTDDHVAAIEAIAVELEGIAPAPGEAPIGFQPPVDTADPDDVDHWDNCVRCGGLVPFKVKTGDPSVATHTCHPRAWDMVDDGTPADDDLLARVIDAFGALDEDRRHWGHGWAADAKRANRPWGVDLTGTTQRIAAINHAAVACLTHLYEDDDTLDRQPQAALRDRATRHALGIVLGDDLQPTWATGTVLGALDVDQALRLGQLAEAFGRGDDDTAALFAPLWGAPTPDLPPEAA